MFSPVGSVKLTISLSSDPFWAARSFIELLSLLPPIFAAAVAGCFCLSVLSWSCAGDVSLIPCLWLDAF